MRLRRERAHPASRIKPKISVIVVVYDMPRQALNTLYSLSRAYQRDVDNVAYEVIVVENLSQRNLKARQVRALGPEFHYLPRQESGVSPVWALRDGLAAARGEVIGLMIDGARMVTPGVLRNVADAYRAFPDAVVATPGFHIGDDDHQNSTDRGHDEQFEEQLLASIPWQENGYLLYQMSTVSAANPFGYLHPMMESNCIFATRQALAEIGGPDERFDQAGGGVLNLDLYRELIERPASQLVVLPGEASFHQFHGGVTTQQDSDREARLQGFRDRYFEVRGKQFHAPLREPWLLGEISPYAMPFLHYSAEQARDRFESRMRRTLPVPAWEDEPVVINRALLDNPTGQPAGPDREEAEMGIYLPDSIRHFHPRHLAFSTWVDHIQFGYDLVAALRPRKLVELGTQAGLSYFAFCQSVQEHDLETLCYAVDTWEGEQHTGAYDESVFDKVSEVNRLNYSGFSYLMRMYFNEALQHFADESIDLLHIDGLHTYDAVKDDYFSWEPKVAPGGIVLFHDIEARLKDFGVWRFWEDLRHELPGETFAFQHGFGLGVWRKPGGKPIEEPLLRYMFDSTPGEQDDLRRFYVHAAMFHDYRRIATGGS